MSEPRVLISAETIAARIRELAQQIDNEYPPDARGYMLTFRGIARTPKGTVTITYPVTAK